MIHQCACELSYTHSRVTIVSDLPQAGVNLCGNAAPILIFKWERRSHTYSYFPVGTQFLQRYVTISIRPILVAQQTTILPLMNVFIYLRTVLRIKLGPVIAPDRHSNCSPFSPSVSPPHSPSLSGVPPSRQTQLAGLRELPQRVRA